MELILKSMTTMMMTTMLLLLLMMMMMMMMAMKKGMTEINDANNWANIVNGAR